jgi:alpha-beta hydrolase superfamily lysophospholipase
MLAYLLTAAALTASPSPAAEREIAAGANGVLKGALVQPVPDETATMIIIPGSGPTDRDGNNGLGASGSYKQLADALATRGIATVRIDKRGLFSSAAAGDPNKVTVATYVADTRAWIAAVRQATGAYCVWLAGHSEGGIVALASAGEKNVCGIVLLATPGRKLGSTIREQLRSNPANAPLLAQAEAALTALEAGRKVDTAAMHPALARGLFNPATQDFLMDLLRQDPAAMVKGSKLPVLVVQGGRDLQVVDADADALSGARPGVERLDYPAMNHVLKDAPEDRAGNIRSYADTARPLTDGLADQIAAFVMAKRR